MPLFKTIITQPKPINLVTSLFERNKVLIWRNGPRRSAFINKAKQQRNQSWSPSLIHQRLDCRDGLLVLYPQAPHNQPSLNYHQSVRVTFSLLFQFPSGRLANKLRLFHEMSLLYKHYKVSLGRICSAGDLPWVVVVWKLDGEIYSTMARYQAKHVLCEFGLTRYYAVKVHLRIQKKWLI